MKIIYLASPYTHPIAAVRHERFLAAEHWVAVNIGRCVPFSSIVMFHKIALEWGHKPTADFWWPTNCRLMRASDEVHILDIEGWQRSTGVKMEIAFARKAQIQLLKTKLIAVNEFLVEPYEGH